MTQVREKAKGRGGRSTFTLHNPPLPEKKPAADPFTQSDLAKETSAPNMAKVGND